jgi:Fur family ferric uptake transcriptional regulator
MTATTDPKSRLTRSQRQIYALLDRANGAMPAQTIYQRLQSQQQSVGLATVYRALRTLQIKGLVQTRAKLNGEWVYTLTTEDRHYLTCLNCGTSIPVEECPAHALEEKLAQASQFQVFYHTLEFFGLCAPCTQAQASKG